MCKGTSLLFDDGDQHNFFHTIIFKVQINALCLFYLIRHVTNFIVRFLIVNLFKNQEPKMLFIFHCNLLTFDYVLCFFFYVFLKQYFIIKI